MTARDAGTDATTGGADDPVEDYLDRSYAHLPADARQARRLLAEAENHLREATEAGPLTACRSRRRAAGPSTGSAA
jgi:hypothetical protein